MAAVNVADDEKMAQEIRAAVVVLRDKIVLARRAGITVQTPEISAFVQWLLGGDVDAGLNRWHIHRTEL